MMRLKILLLAAAFAAPFSPAAADVGSATSNAPASKRNARPTVLSDVERANYLEVFAAIQASDWAAATARLDGMGDGPLHAIARAELYLAKGSPKVELEPLLALIAKAPDMPEAAQLSRLAQARGATTLPLISQPQQLVWQGEQPRRARVRSVVDPAAAKLDPLVQPLIVDNRPSEAEAFLTEALDRLTPESRTEYQQRIAWSYYIIGRDADARRLAELARVGIGEWALQGEWVAGLAAWRQGDCEAAGNSFSTVAARATDPELNAAGHYWAARADMKCRRPERVQTRLRNAARLNETFYGLLASSALGVRQAMAKQLHDYGDAEWQGIAAKPNVKAAIALNEIGERGLADMVITHEARIGGASEHNALLHLAADLDLAGTQFWLAHNAPAGARVNLSARYPDPDWRPMQGWRVDKALAFAHALQESNFRTQVVSPAGASGLMQVRPGTASDMAKRRGEPFEAKQLSEPTVNLEYGQRYLEFLRDSGGTDGLLLKVIAAYNAGPLPVAEWNARAFDQGDPLLYIESIPYWETRGYVPIILRNYWIYEQKEGRDGGTGEALAQGLWPKFPGAKGAAAVRLTAQQPQPPQPTAGPGGGSR